jgi:hypothetical protein
MEIYWKTCTETYNKTADTVLGKKPKRANKEWITGKTLKLIEERKKIHNKINTTNSDRLLKKYKEEYHIAHKNVKKISP